MNQRLAWMADAAHWACAAVPLVHAFSLLVRLPNVPPPVLFYLAPPLIAGGLIGINQIHGTNPTIIRGCRIFLTLIALSVLLGELPFILANLKPQFPGLPAADDRVFSFYMLAYLLSLGLLLPAYVLGASIHRHLRKQPTSVSLPTCCVGAVTWLASLGVMVACVPTILARLF